VSADPLPLRLLPDTASVASNGQCSVGGVTLEALAHQYGTPLFVYDEQTLRNRAREAVGAFGQDNVVYATKAFLCLAMAKLADEEGLRLDVSTGGELHVALQAGVSPDRCIFHGSNKSMAELRMALKLGVGHIVVDSFDELDRLDSLGREGLPVPRVQLRITPGVQAHTHEFVATGQDDSKFGFNVGNGDALAAVRRAEAASSVELVGIHAHLGSQVFNVENFAAVAERVAAFSEPLGLPELTLGGGLGVAYTADEVAPTLTDWAKVLLAEVEREGIKARVMVEPGRALVAQAGITLYEVGTIKTIPGVRTYVSVDGGISDNPRPVLYGSGYEAFLPRATAQRRPTAARIVGKHCESGDVVVFEGWLGSDVAVGDVLGTPVTGAYGYNMASNYNKVPRPAVVFVSDGQSRVVVRRETYEDLVRNDVV
jgi:diaminopimelate decarboxylase